jgi:cyclophilin family peptidyl-prolyl cis-trans isomerase
MDSGERGAKLNLEIAGKGTLVIQLNTAKAPKTTEHIIKLASEGFYNGQKFFKVVRQPRPFAIYFGDPITKSKAIDDSSIGTGGSGASIPYENSGMTHRAGSVGLSRKPGDPNSGDCQFYVCLGDYGFLDGQYTVFGQVTAETMPLLDKIERGDVVAKATISD